MGVMSSNYCMRRAKSDCKIPTYFALRSNGRTTTWPNYRYTERAAYTQVEVEIIWKKTLFQFYHDPARFYGCDGHIIPLSTHQYSIYEWYGVANWGSKMTSKIIECKENTSSTINYCNNMLALTTWNT